MRSLPSVAVENCMHMAVNYWFHLPDRHSCESDLAAEDAATQTQDDTGREAQKKKKRKEAGVSAGVVVSTKKSRTGSVLHRVDEGYGDSTP
jgi:hypothetical protein